MIEIRLAELSERQVVRNLMELYQHDFSELDGTELDEHGRYGYEGLDLFWEHPAWSAFVMKVDQHWAGFVLTNDEVLIKGNMRAIAEFFVVRKYRGQGLATKAAEKIMTMHPAQWEVCVIEENPAARNFWETLIDKKWPGKCQSEFVDNEHWCGPIFSVDTRASGIPDEVEQGK